MAHLLFGPVQFIDANDYHNVLEGNIDSFSCVGALEKSWSGHLRNVTGMNDGCEEY